MKQAQAVALPLTEQARDWLRAHTVLIERDGRQVYAVDSRAYWELLGKPKKRHADWWNYVVKSRNLQEGKDFFELVAKNATNSQRGRKATQHLLPKTTALKLGAITNTELGRAILDRLVEIAERVESGDLALVEEILARSNDPQKIERVVRSAQERMIALYRRQGKSLAWIAKRLEGMSTRSLFTDVLKEHGVAGIGYGSITDGMYLELFERTAKMLREERGLARSAPARDGLSLVELCKASLAEAMSVEELGRSEAQGNSQCQSVCLHQARKVASIQ